MQRISKLSIKNFKFFLGEVEIDFERKNVLLYGENGSGKSSIYWALYTFLQSVFKTDPLEIRKYFDPKNDKNLINRFADDAEGSYIIMEMEDEHKASSKREISLTTINTKPGRPDNLIYDTTLGSDFIDHKVLSRIYAYYHQEKVDLFDFFYHHLMAFINFREEFVKPGEVLGTKNAERWWDYFRAGISPRPKMKDQIYLDFQSFILKFNIEFKFYIEKIEQLTNEILKDRFKEKFKIKFEYVNGTYNDFKIGTKSRIWQVKAPQIILSVELTTNLINSSNKKRIESPQSFLNEAKLSSLALAMRLAILDEKYVAAYPKVLVLDDMLMSMDMSNREFVLDIILGNYLADYQILFFTHQRGLFEDARRFIESYYGEKLRKTGESKDELIKNAWKEDWKVFEMYETENDSKIPVPSIQLYETSMQKALMYFKNPIDYNSCGNNLRAALEEFFLDYIPHNYLNNQTMLGGLIVSARAYFNYLGFDTNPIDKLDRYRERSLNPTSHHNPRTEYYKRELQEIFSILDGLKKNRNEPVLKKDQKVKFEIKTQSGKVFNYTAVLLDHIRLYKKSDGSASFFKDSDERAYAMIGCTENNTNTTMLSHDINRCTIQTLYDDTVAYINRTDVAIVEANLYIVFTDQNGKTLEDLKKY